MSNNSTRVVKKRPRATSRNSNQSSSTTRKDDGYSLSWDDANNNNNIVNVKMVSTGSTFITLRGCGSFGFRRPTNDDHHDDHIPREVLGYPLDPDEIVPFEVLPWEPGIPISLDNPNTILRVHSTEDLSGGVDNDENRNNNNNNNEDGEDDYNNGIDAYICGKSRPYGRPTTIPTSWTDAVNQLVNNNRLCVAFAGAKNVGKSTCLKYFAHRLLKHQNGQGQRIAILDADPGQPIISLPGILQLSVIQSPLFATRTISKQVVRSLFFGSVSSSSDPVLYLSQIRELLQSAETLLDENTPVLVNLDGWIHGLGRQILSTVLEYMRKDAHVVVISGDSASKKLNLSEDILDPSRLHVCWAFNSIHNHNEANTSQPPSQSSTANSVELNNIDEEDGDNGDDKMDDNSDDEGDDDVEIPLQPRTLTTHSTAASTIRGVRLLAYFVPQLFDNTRLITARAIDDPYCEIATSLAAELPYAVSLDAIPILYPHEVSRLSEELRLNVLNESIVGLLTENGDCRGLGIVRAIDRIKRILYILTPTDDISSVCTLAVATFHLPVEASFLGVQSESFRYQSFDDKLDTILGATPMKSRNNIARRSG